MSKPGFPTSHGFISSIHSAWRDLYAFLSAVTPSEALKRDHAGWSVKDHVTHMAVWEDSVEVLFHGGSRHEALGIGGVFYSCASFDEINEVIKTRFEDVPLAQAVGRLEQVHNQLLVHLEALSEVDLHTQVRDFFPQALRSDDRPLSALVYDNTVGHFSEHLGWMRNLVEGGRLTTCWSRPSQPGR